MLVSRDYLGLAGNTAPNDLGDNLDNKNDTQFQLV